MRRHLYTALIGQFLIPAQERAYIATGLARLGYASLWDYELSDTWKARRERYYQGHEYRCCACDARHGLELNHRTYRNLGHEPDADLEWRCDACHRAFHETWTALAEQNKKPLPSGKGFWHFLYVLFFW